MSKWRNIQDDSGIWQYNMHLYLVNTYYDYYSAIVYACTKRALLQMWVAMYKKLLQIYRKILKFNLQEKLHWVAFPIKKSNQ